MATINLNDINAVGAELFQDSENYLNELGNGELSNVRGGWTHIAYIISMSIFIAVCNAEK